MKQLDIAMSPSAFVQNPYYLTRAVYSPSSDPVELFGETTGAIFMNISRLLTLIVQLCMPSYGKIPWPSS